MVTLHDMGKLQSQYSVNGEKDKLAAILKDSKTVLKLGK
jgi:hypothetical protein